MYLFPDIKCKPVLVVLSFSPLFHFYFSSSLFFLALLPPVTPRFLRHSPTLTSVLIAASLFCISQYRLSVSSSWQRSTGLFLGVSLPILSSLHYALL